MNEGNGDGDKRGSTAKDQNLLDKVNKESATQGNPKVDLDQPSSSHPSTYAKVANLDREKAKVNFWSLEYGVGTVEADLFIPMASVQEGHGSFARALIWLDFKCWLKDILVIAIPKLDGPGYKTETIHPKAGKQKDVQDDGSQSVKQKTSKCGNCSPFVQIFAQGIRTSLVDPSLEIDQYAVSGDVGYGAFGDFLEHRYTVSSLIDTAYRMSESVIFRCLRLSSRMRAF
ncbi:hypothetical protein Tco_1070157 [Tanacetum coccineum]|uniref:Uncharacterized protein n=1 Tax=Tanacetum coccineum TaxID=301880 RepID=A0ABQ5HMH8_9ASTR